jgi:hypothetical protein
MPIDFAHKKNLLLKITDKAVIPVETGIQKVSKSQFLWTPALAGVTNQFNKCFFYELSP